MQTFALRVPGAITGDYPYEAREDPGATRSSNLTGSSLRHDFSSRRTHYCMLHSTAGSH